MATVLRQPAPETVGKGPHGWVRREAGNGAVMGRLPLWPLQALLVLYPLWWALGVTAFVFIVLAVPMAVALANRRPFRFPPGFLLWALFLSWVLVGSALINIDVPGTLPVSDGAGRYLAYGLRTANYFAVTVVMLYVGNLTERELPRLRLIRWMGALFVTTVVGGLAGTFLPNLTLPMTIGRLLPAGLRQNDYVGALLTPAVAQVQQVLGYSSPRPSAPFEYTNAWGNNFSLLLIWFVVGWLVVGSTKRRVVAAALLACSIIPVIYSLNRGLWLGLAVSAVYVAVRLVIRGKVTGVASVATAVAAALAVVAFSPLGNVVQERFDNPHSDSGRNSLSRAAYNGAVQSPIVGWGSGRATIGSERGIAIGATPDCKRCGNRAIGSNGQLWLMIFAHGFVGAAFYVGFFLYSMWRYRRDHSVIGIAGGLAIALPLLYMLTYSGLTSPLCLYVIAVALLWRNERLRSGQDDSEPDIAGPDHPSPRSDLARFARRATITPAPAELR